MTPAPAMASGSVLHPDGRDALSAKARLNALQARLNDALANYSIAKDAASRPWETVEEISFDIADYHRGVQFRQRDADPDEAYTLTQDFITSITEHGLIAEPLDPKRPALGFRLTDPSLAPAVEATAARARAAAQARDAFLRDNAALLEEHAKRQRVGRIKESLDSDDPAVFLDAFSDLAGHARDTHANSLTTADMAGIR